ncbi:MAG: hypothetical protein KME13_02650 [Myxacorys californica WJT36-NPBG1]|nr:hypothetical protein [Myxacorys californica WJT36-NPBG1]
MVAHRIALSILLRSRFEEGDRLAKLAAIAADPQIWSVQREFLSYCRTTVIWERVAPE